jgi:hypothetical protein
MQVIVIGVFVGALVLLLLLRGIGMYVSRRNARRILRYALAEEVRSQRTAPRRQAPQQEDVERGQVMREEPLPVYSKGEEPPEYDPVRRPPEVHFRTEEGTIPV